MNGPGQSCSLAPMKLVCNANKTFLAGGSYFGACCSLRLFADDVGTDSILRSIRRNNVFF